MGKLVKMSPRRDLVRSENISFQKSLLNLTRIKGRLIPSFRWDTAVPFLPCQAQSHHFELCFDDEPLQSIGLVLTCRF